MSYGSTKGKPNHGASLLHNHPTSNIQHPTSTMSYSSSPSSGWTLDDSELPPLSETWEDNLQEPTWKEFLIPSLFHEETPDRPTPRPPLSSNIVNTQSTYTRSSHISDPAQCDTLSTEPDSYNFNAPTVPDDDWTKLPTTICPLDLLPPGSELRERTVSRILHSR